MARVRRLGQYAYAISVSKEDLESANLRVGDEVKVLALPNHLVISKSENPIDFNKIKNFLNKDESIEDFIKNAVKKEIDRRKSFWHKTIVEI
jgi:nicotinic acid mononucleotide adenylyltransferase